jgi:alpha-ketoglutarate-dependent taurine dioxygenase
MSRFPTQPSDLSAEKQQLVDLLLRKKGITVPRRQTILRRAAGVRGVLSFAQERLWFLDKLVPGSPLYNLCRAIRLRGQLDLQAMGRSINEIVRRHEILRTTFDEVEGKPVQVIASPAWMHLPIIALDELPASQKEREAKRLATQEAQRPFDLRRGPLLKVIVVRMSAGEHMLVVTMHHIVSDAWSTSVMVRELVELYERYSAGEESGMEELGIQYGDYAAWQRENLRGEVLEEHLSYWKKQLAGVPTLLKLPADFSRSATQSYKGAFYAFTLSVDLSAAFKALSNREGATLFMTLLAVFQILIYRYSEQQDFLVGVDVANRNRIEVEGLIGFFINMLVMRADLSGDPNFREFLGRVRKMALGAYAHQDLPFDKLVEELQPQRSLSHTPLFQVVFNFDNAQESSLALPGLELSPQPFDYEMVRFDLSLFMNEKSGRLCGSWRYRTDLFTDATIARMQGNFEALLRSIVAQPDARLSALEMRTEAEKQERATTKREIKASNFKKLKSIVPKAVSASRQSLIKTYYLDDEEKLPLVIEPAVKSVGLLDWARGSLDLIETELIKHGAILFRNFDLSSVDEFSGFASITSKELLDYSEPSSPRTEIRDKIYTSTDYPASQWIQLHNEMSYSHNWPGKLFFFCVEPAVKGGQTPLAYSSKVFNLISPKIKERFIEKKVMYVRNFGEGVGLSWQHVFNSSERSTVQEYCSRAGIGFEWGNHNRLKTRQVRQAVARHPKTGDLLWFNQAHAFHMAVLQADVRESLLSLFKEEDFPSCALYGDGSPIESSVIDEICEAYRSATLMFPWQAGDLLLVENMLVAHGRAPFEGSRRILVSMSELIDSKDVERGRAPVTCNKGFDSD